ncbi:hypothetical protein CVT24_010492 [Panaeolus cyanescens]|uniref:pyranose dehydrogenase (acceptor) n=1 Tax=Panaeolus cyanescens TaxID=181874 RepID=A0A409YLP6_9AGAR|nr:hypothetical protein CVT24_010492 [Panaeolus cyanescens]
MHKSTFVSFVLAALYVAPSLAATYTQPYQLPRISYDYVIVGAGNAGNVIASKLSEDPNIQVLVLEAGGSDENVLPAIVPFLGPTLTPNTPYDWNYTVAAQEGLDNRSFAYPRGKILGGCSTANYMVHHYGSSDDWDKLASVTGDSGWSWDSVRQYRFQHEKMVPPADGHDTTGQWDPSLHGTNGPVSISLPGHSQTIDAKVIATTQELSDEFPFLPDTGGGDILGVGWTQNSIGNGQRSSSSTAYLRPASSRPNLHILLNAHVMKLLPTGINFRDGKPIFGGVMFANPSNRIVLPFIVLASKEVILSAGAINTPQILMLSGIGPRSELNQHRILTLVDNPSVGRNLSDHVLLPNNFLAQGSESLDTLFRDGNAFQSALDQWTQHKTGPLANGVTNHLGFLRLPNNATIFQTEADPAAGPKASHWELIVSNFWLNPSAGIPATGNFMTIIAALISPTSRGFVKLASSDPFAKPIIDPKLVTTPFDKFAMREAVRAVKRFVGASAWDDYIIGPYGSLAADDDAGIDAHVRQWSSTVFHPVGTAAMSPANAQWGVVDPNLKLKGAHGVRIADASVLPYVPNAHTQGPVYLVAHRAAALIKADQ